jgi:hypothetical protein
MFQTKVVEKIKTHVLCSATFFRKSCPLWDNVQEYGRAWHATDDNIIRRMRFPCWLTKATNTHSEYVIRIAFPRRKWLRQRASVLRYRYIACLVFPYTASISALYSTQPPRRWIQRTLSPIKKRTGSEDGVISGCVYVMMPALSGGPNCAVNVVSRLLAGWPRVQNPAGAKALPVLQSVLTAPGATQPPIKCVPADLSSRTKQQGSEVDQSCLSSAHVKNDWRYTSTFPICFHGINTDKFIFLSSLLIPPGHAVKVAGSIPDGIIGIFHWLNPSGSTMALESTQLLTEMSTRSIS